MFVFCSVLNVYVNFRLDISAFFLAPPPPFPPQMKLGESSQ